uniref:Uncharacterized protein n=1 Tax=viral metagenome TaxID=1070528 RepID=A0A6M3IZK4_9ZZZZ
MANKTEGTAVKEEGVVAEKVEPTQPETKPTERTFATEAEFQKAVSKGLEAYTRQLSAKENEAKTAKAETDATKAMVTALEEAVKDLEKKLEEDDPDKLKDYQLTLRERKAALREAELQRKATELEQAELDKAGMLVREELEAHAKELNSKRNIPMAVLNLCATIEAMDSIAENFPEVEPVSEDVLEGKPKFNTPISSGAKTPLGDLSPSEMLKEIEASLRT